MEEITQAPVEAPVEPVTEPTAEAVAAPEPQLYELPDGKKVDAETLAKEFSQNFYPEYTRKSQELSALKSKFNPQPENKEPIQAPWETDPNWTAENYSDLAAPLKQQITREVWEEIAKQAEAVEREEQERTQAVQQEIDYIKSIDKDADPGKVMSHAAKFQFPSLVAAWQNLKTIDEAVKIAEERAVKNMTQRAANPVGVPPASGNATPSFPPDVRTGLEKARWALKNSK